MKKNSSRERFPLQPEKGRGKEKKPAQTKRFKPAYLAGFKRKKGEKCRGSKRIFPSKDKEADLPSEVESKVREEISAAQ